MQVLILRLLRSPIFRQLVKAVMVAVFEAVAAGRTRSTRSRLER
jgi:hypothetical protein